MTTENGVAGRTIWCRWADCAEAYVSVAGRLPDICPACSRQARWTTIAPFKMTPNYFDPIKPYELTPIDQSFLKSIKVDPEAE